MSAGAPVTRVSIAMATYNGEPHLEEQLRSFEAQSRPPDELVVCDDGSTDGTIERLHRFAETAPFRVQVVQNESRLGYNGNFAKAVGLCTGDLILISDQDDHWYPHKIGSVLRAFEARPRALSITNDQMITDGDGRPTGVTVLGNVRRLGFSDDLFGPGCCTALRREALPILQPFATGIVPYDHWITAIPVLLGARILLEEPLQTYRRHGSNTSGSDFADPKAGFRRLASADRGGQIDAFGQQVRMIDAIAGRLHEREAEIAGLGLDPALPAAWAELDAQKAAYEGRRSALQVGLARRVPMVGALLARGHYRRFHGYRSAIKDLIT